MLGLIGAVAGAIGVLVESFRRSGGSEPQERECDCEELEIQLDDCRHEKILVMKRLAELGGPDA